MGTKVFGYKITGADKLIKGFNKFQVECLAGQVRAVQESTILIYNEAVQSLQANSDGTPQIRYKPKRVVAVSKPFTPPNTDTGRAVQSIKMDFQKGGIIGRVGTNLKYLAQLEFGTKLIAPRPWLSRAVEVVSKDIAVIFKKALKQSVKDSEK